MKFISKKESGLDFKITGILCFGFFCVGSIKNIYSLKERDYSDNLSFGEDRLLFKIRKTLGPSHQVEVVDKSDLGY